MAKSKINKEHEVERKAGEERFKKFCAEKRKQLQGKNIVEHLKFAYAVEEATKDYFRFLSPAWKAIQDHIQYDKDCVIIEHERDEDGDANIAYHRGVGSIHMRNVWLYKGSDSEFYGMNIGVDYSIGNNRYDYRTVSYPIAIPIDLELNFTKRKFQGWIKKLRNERDKKTREEEAVILQKLMKKYPDAKPPVKEDKNHANG